jgi:hypothetical protein
MPENQALGVDAQAGECVKITHICWVQDTEGSGHQRDPNIEHRTSNIEHPTSNIE